MLAEDQRAISVERGGLVVRSSFNEAEWDKPFALWETLRIVVADKRVGLDAFDVYMIL